MLTASQRNWHCQFLWSHAPTYAKVYNYCFHSPLLTCILSERHAPHPCDSQVQMSLETFEPHYHSLLLPHTVYGSLLCFHFVSSGHSNVVPTPFIRRISARFLLVTPMLFPRRSYIELSLLVTPMLFLRRSYVEFPLYVSAWALLLFQAILSSHL